MACLLFDLDGTLLDTRNLIISSFQHTFEKHLGLKITPEELYPYFGEPLITTMERFDPKQGRAMVDTYRAHNLIHHDEKIEIFPGVAEIIPYLYGKGHKLGIVTSKLRMTAERGIKFFGLEDYFDTFVTIDDTKNHKPHPEPIYLALERLQHKDLNNVYMIGDSPFDIQCAHNAGVKSCALGWSVFSKEQLMQDKPHYYLDSIKEMVDLAEKL
jgi:pyrophosphatase PpaX